MEWHQLENFIAVAKYQHFTKAAQHQLISQPALSRSIMKLEQDLGVPLFIREGRNVQLTRFGESFLQKAQQAQLLIQQGKDEIQEKISPETGEIAVAFLHTLGPHLIPNLISKYKKMYPNLTFQLFQGANEYVIDLVEKGIADMCLSLPPVHHQRLEWIQLNTESLYIVVPKQHHLANESEVSFQSLEKEDFICFKKGYGLRNLFDEMCTHLRVSPKITFEGEEATTVAGFVSKGLGIALLPKISDIINEEVHFLKINDYVCQRTIALTTLSDPYITPIAKRFKEFVVQNYLEGSSR